MSKLIRFSVNGSVAEADCRADMTVLEWLRGVALLRGSKEGCAEGDCGACSVLIKRQNEESYTPANSCIMLMAHLEGTNLVTVEGLAAMGPHGHEVQAIMAQNGSSQCGFCTPGIVCSLAGLLEKTTDPDDSSIHDALAGNLCRCTGYKPIVEAARRAAGAGSAPLPEVSLKGARQTAGSTESVSHFPTTLAELVELRADDPDAILLAGGTDLALDVAHAKARWSSIILTRHVEELRDIRETQDEISFGGAVTWADALPHFDRHWPSLATMIRRFGSTQIRSMGTLAGNLANASPIGDGPPPFMALDAQVVLASVAGERVVPINEFFLGYRDSALQPEEVIKCITIPKPEPDLQFRVYKISKRYDQDISSVCGAFAIKITDGVVQSARIAFGGMAATPLRCRSAEQVLVGNRLDDEAVIYRAKEAIGGAFAPLSDMRGTARYRATIASNLLERLVHDLAGETIEVMAL